MVTHRLRGLHGEKGFYPRVHSDKRLEARLYCVQVYSEELCVSWSEYAGVFSMQYISDIL